MHDSKVIASCIASRDAYDKVKSYVDSSELSPMGGFWWKLVAAWYEADSGAVNVDKDILLERGRRQVDPAHEDTMVGWFSSLPDDVSPLNVVTNLLEVKRLNKGMELMAAMSANDNIPKIKHLLAQYDELLVAAELGGEKAEYAVRGEELFNVMSNEAKWTLAPLALNERTDGGVHPGDFIIIFGKKEMGKTLFLINLNCHWLRQGARSLWIGNEDKIDKIKYRHLCNLANMTPAEVQKWPAEALKRAQAKGFDDRLFLVRTYPGTMAEVEEYVKEHEPDILIVDQIRNIDERADSTADRMESAAKKMRSMVAKYGMVGVATAQAYAGDHNKDKVWLENTDIDSSRTGLPGQGDLILGIGADAGMKEKNARAMSLCTNKISGNHEGFLYQIDKHRNKVR